MKLTGPVCVLSLMLFAAPPIAAAAEDIDCHVGSYKLADGGVVDIGLGDDEGTLRWTRFDGTSGQLHPTVAGKTWTSTAGWSDKPDGMSVSFPGCDSGEVDFNGVSGHRVPFDVQDLSFKGNGVQLAGRLTLPKGTDKVPVVVLVHGADTTPTLDSGGVMSTLQRLLPAEGIGVFAYDKRGTGKSTGKYTQDYELLAHDADAALDQARRLAGARLGRIGFWGGSQGGWVAPLAANHTQADFVIVGYGLAVNVMDEDQEAVEFQMHEKGYTPQVIAQAQQLAHAAEVVVVTDFKQGYPELDAMRAKYGKQPWFKDVQGNFAYFVLSQPDDAKLRAMAKDFDWQIPYHYDPMPVLRASKTPQLWILGGEDDQAPSAETSRRIRSLMAGGLPFTLVIYPHAQHVMTLFEIRPDGTRLRTRFAPGYFGMIRDFAKDGHLTGTYGDAEISVRP